MHETSVWVRFGLVLEAYCRSALDGHISSLSRQVELVNKLKSISEVVRAKKEKLKCTQQLQDSLREERLIDPTGVLNPLDPSYRCRNIRYALRDLFFVGVHVGDICEPTVVEQKG